MIDTLMAMLPHVRNASILSTLDLQHEQHVVITLHRPSNVDDPLQLAILLDEIGKMSEHFDIIWPIHPRTKARIESIGKFENLEANPSIHITKPLGYIDFMKCIYESRMVVTDSGGIQEETTWLGVPCITLRPNTERPITISAGTNVLSTPAELSSEIQKVITEPRRKNITIALWDGKTAERCVTSLLEFLS